jgi:molybdate transport repressor ModE-like protein
MQWTVTLEGRIDHAGISLPILETLAILDGIAAGSALKGAALRTGLSYRAIWDKLARIEALLGCAAAHRVKGHGTRLTPAGDALRATLDAARRRLEPVLAQECAELGAALAHLAPRNAPPRLVLAASHDPLLSVAAQSFDWLRLDTQGSGDAIAALQAGRADLAGCHFGEDAAAPPADTRDALLAAGFEWRRIFRRAQGLMVAPGNPLGLRDIADVAGRKARVVNRQRGSGTRLLFDRLLARAGIAPTEIRGYADEEFTHQAVAAVIAAGRADVGLGVHAAAAKFGLDFLPLADESYFLIVPPQLQTDPRIHALLDLIEHTKSTFPGYG